MSNYFVEMKLLGEVGVVEARAGSVAMAATTATTSPSLPGLWSVPSPLDEV
jgi:hypothetical protein